MKHNPYLLAFLLTIPLLFSGGCDHFDQGCSFEFSNTWTVENLDNSGAQPSPSVEDIPRTAYGLRVSNLNPVVMGDNCDYYYSTSSVSTVQIFTMRPFNGYPAGSDVSHEFFVRTQIPPAKYLSVENAVGELFSPEKIGAAVYTDLLLLKGPEAADSCQFKVQFMLTKTDLAAPIPTTSVIIDLKTIPVLLK